MGPWSKRIGVLIKETQRARALSPALADPHTGGHASTQLEGGCLQPKGRTLTRYQPCWHLHVELLASRIVRKYISVVWDHSQSVVFHYGRPSKLMYLLIQVFYLLTFLLSSMFVIALYCIAQSIHLIWMKNKNLHPSFWMNKLTIQLLVCIC